MTKLFKTLSVMLVVATAGTLGGCELYFGDHGDRNDHWSYCGSDGEYSCDGDDCTWVSPTCTGSDVGPGSAECGANTDCAAGCYCDTGTCTEAGFCGSDGDCGPGYVCDVSRSSCEPAPTQPKCGSNADCPTGSLCDTATGACGATCACTDDTDATDQGYGWCDETRGTCMTGEDPTGSCTAAVTCNTKAPKCADNQVPLVLDGCYTGECRAIASCEGAPTCSALQHEDDCLARGTDCSAVYTGNNCKKANGSACKAGDTGCTCESFTFNSCDAKNASLAPGFVHN